MLSVYQSVCIPTLIYSHKLLVVPERIRSRLQAAEVRILHRVAELTLSDRELSNLGKDQSRATATPNQEESVKMARAPNKNGLCM